MSVTGRRGRASLLAMTVAATVAAVGLTPGADQPAAAASAVSFTDVPASQPFHTEISWLAERGVTTGYLQPDGTRLYKPADSVSRDAMAAFMYRLAGSPTYTPPATSPFADVPTDRVFYKEIAWLASQGISTGWQQPDGTRLFKPMDLVARDAMAAFMYRYGKSPVTTSPATSPFTDVPTNRVFYKEISWLADRGISTGYAQPDGTKLFKPTDPVARDAMAAFMYRLSKAGVTTRVTAGDRSSTQLSTSTDGRYVVFSSYASDLVSGDTNEVGDIFVWDRVSGQTTRITDGNGDSSSPSVSGDGRYVAFASTASNLVVDDTNSREDIFVWDRVSNETTRITNGNDRSAGTAISGDGRYVSFYSQATDIVPGSATSHGDVYLWDRESGETTRITTGDRHSWPSDISDDGRYVSFSSGASNLIPGDYSNAFQVYVLDRESGALQRTKGDFDTVGGKMSDDGRYVTLSSSATNLAPDDNLQWDVIVWDRESDEFTRITGGETRSEQPTISADGRYITYTSQDVGAVIGPVRSFVFDRSSGATTKISAGDISTGLPTISGDGQHVAYLSHLQHPTLIDPFTNEPQRIADVFVWDRQG